MTTWLKVSLAKIIVGIGFFIFEFHSVARLYYDQTTIRHKTDTKVIKHIHINRTFNIF